METGAISDVQSLSVGHPSRTAFEGGSHGASSLSRWGPCPNPGAAAV